MILGTRDDTVTLRAEVITLLMIDTCILTALGVFFRVVRVNNELLGRTTFTMIRFRVLTVMTIVAITQIRTFNASLETLTVVFEALCLTTVAPLEMVFGHLAYIIHILAATLTEGTVRGLDINS